jgi:hypothetical protein
MRRNKAMRQPLSWQRGGLVALVVLAVVAAAALFLDAGTGAEFEPLQEHLRTQGRPPVEAVEAAGRVAQIVVLSDIAGVAGPKRLAADAIRALAEGPGLDAVVLEVPADEQPYIDAYLARGEEDATLLLGRPRAVPDRGAQRDYLEIYRAVWRMNQEVGAARRIRIIAADHPEWPPAEGASPQNIAATYAQRAPYMVQRIDDELLSIMPEARLLVFVDGYQALQRTHGSLQFAGGAATEIPWLAELLRQRAQLRTVLVDAAVPPGQAQRLPGYHGTELFRPLRRAVNRNVGVRIDETFAIVRSPVRESSSPGLRLEIEPTRYTLRDAADVYVLLRGGR